MNKPSTQFNYGYAAGMDLQSITFGVCREISPATAQVAARLVLETMAQETRLGFYNDRTPTSAGVGLAQIDPIAFADIVSRTPKKRKTLIRDTWSIDLDSLQHRDLAYSPLLSIIFCRLFYALISEPIPDTIKGRAAYWKKHYNTELGDGTVQQYFDTAAIFFLS